MIPLAVDPNDPARLQEQFNQFLVAAGVPRGPGEPPVAGGDSGGDNGGMEPRVAKLEAAVEHIQGDIADVKTDLRQIRSDLRTQFYWVLGGFAAILAVLAKGFNWL